MLGILSRRLLFAAPIIPCITHSGILDGEQTDTSVRKPFQSTIREDLLTAIENSPELKSVSLFRDAFHVPQPTSRRLSLPYDRLVHLEINPPQELWHLQALGECRQLGTLVIRRSAFLARDLAIPNDPIHLPALRYLRILPDERFEPLG